ncbi:short transient receptor potential channel 6-like [Tigriopus californicus]|uniref:short transient receptor potential channel 6-like n=1 Tax=Tigriopus californicus TaxID=6832 RepID=UPI0027D9F73D|nr:short transient receptor potential channel 6-like [Tigriopus californicus]
MDMNMSSLYPEMRFSWEIKSVDALFCNGMTRVGDLSREAILQAIKDEDLSVLKEDVNRNLFNDKKFCKECVTTAVASTQNIDIIEEIIDFLTTASEETRGNVDASIKEALRSAVKVEDEHLVLGILDNFHNNKKIKTLTDMNELIEHAVYCAAVQEDSNILHSILKWNLSNKTKKFTHKSKAYAGSTGGPKINSGSLLYAAKKNDYERVKIMFRYGYRLERIEKITDPLKRIELFKAITSPAYIIATLENVNDVSSEFFCPVKKCFEFACEASAKAKNTPEYKREYQEIEHRCEDYAISLLEQCENLEEVETFLQTKTHDGITHKDANYIMAILDSRKKFVAHERFQYVLLKKFGETEFKEDYAARNQTLWIDMPWYLRFMHVLKQIPCYLLLFLFPVFSQCCPWSNPAGNGTISSRVPWFVRQWRVPLNRCIYTAFSYMMFLFFIILYVAETQPPIIYWIDIFTATWIMSYTCRDMGTAYFLWKLENPKPMQERRFFKRYLTFWHLYNLFADFFFLIGLLMKLVEYLMTAPDSSVHDLVDMNNLAAGGRILWGAAFSLAILKTIKVGIASKYFGPIILSMNHMMKDVLLFLMTFVVIMIAFACGVSYIFNMASGQQGSGSATRGVFTYFFWVLLQPFRGNPEYADVVDLPYNTTCLSSISSQRTNRNTLARCIVETMYNTSCIIKKLGDKSGSRVTHADISSCLIDREAGFGSFVHQPNYLKSAAVPMWAVYQFLVSVVLLRILIVMMTITYRRIYDDLDKQWKYARAYMGIQFFDHDSLLPPPFTFLSIVVLIFQLFSDCRKRRTGKNADNSIVDAMPDQTYATLIFQLLDGAKPTLKVGEKDWRKKSRKVSTNLGDKLIV